jgi:tRNA A37 methylthiotransferase MiaB
MVYYNVYLDTNFSNCVPNLIGISMIYRYLIENGHKITNNILTADFIIINSCGYSNKAQDISIQLFNKYYYLKKKNAKIILYGCLVKINKERLIPLDLYLISFNDKYKLDKFFYNGKKFDTIKPYCDQETRNNIIEEKKLFDFWENIPYLLSKLFGIFFKKIRINYNHIITHLRHTDRIFVEICKGCVSNCSYCAIKKAKGNPVSRIIEDIILDIKNKYNSSKKIFLVADDCGSFGFDIDTNLIKLINEIKKKYPGSSIDLNYLNPLWLDKYSSEYISLFRNNKINFVTIPMQSGSNKIIKNMNRYYDVKKVINTIKKIKKVSPKTVIMSHFIVGYPGENTKDFFKTLSVIKFFDYFQIFKYSDIQGTKSISHTNKKSNIIKSFRWFLIILFINYINLYKLLNYKK